MRIRSIGLVAAATVFVLIGQAGVAAAAPAGPNPQRQDLQSLLDRLVGADNPAGPGAIGAIAEVRQGTVLWRGVSGRAVRGGSRPAPVDGRFRAGSVTKTFTATVVLQLAAEGRLRLSDSVRRWLPGLVARGGEAISVQDLLQHTTGLPEYADDLVFPKGHPQAGLPRERFRTWTPQELVRVGVAHLDPQVPPDPDPAYDYSSTNYIVLGMVIEKVTGHSYAAELQRRILRPLGLRNTRIPGAFPLIAGPHAHGYIVDTRKPADGVDITVMNPSMAGAAGEIVSTTADLNRFYRALFTGRLLPPAQLAAMMTPRSPGGYGFGLESAVLNVPGCGRIYGHGGITPGYRTVSFHSPDGGRQLTLSWTPWTGSTEPVALELLKVALCP